MPPATPAVETVGLAGTGVIGAGWAVRALARGCEVVAWDPADGAEGRLRAAVDRAWPSAVRLGLFPGADRRKLRWADSAEEVAVDADWIQENAPEDEELKRHLLRRLAAAAGPGAVIASSSSGLLPSRLQSGCRHPERILIGHPFNPVYLLPLVEVVAGRDTSPAAVERAVAFYDDLVMHPLVVRNEIEGYLSDRLQEALWREILHLVNDGVATTGELDDAVVYGPGLRWAAMGTNLTFHLAGGAGGMAHMLSQFGPALKLPWTKLAAPELTADLARALATGCAEQAAGRSVEELEELRDEYLLAVMRALRPVGIGAGRLVAEREARIHAAAAAAGPAGAGGADGAGRGGIGGAGGGGPWTPGAEVGAPLELYEAQVEPDWVDYNDHMTEAAFLVAFGWASDKLFRYVGIDEAYRDAGHSFYTVETHLNYLREAALGEPIRVSTQVLGVDAKRLHFFHSMRHGSSGELLCTTEQMLVHVDTAAGRSAPIRPGPAAALAAVAEAHASLPAPPQAGSRMSIG